MTDDGSTIPPHAARHTRGMLPCPGLTLLNLAGPRAALGAELANVALPMTVDRNRRVVEIARTRPVAA